MRPAPQEGASSRQLLPDPTSHIQDPILRGTLVHRKAMALVNDLTCLRTSLGLAESWHVACGAHPSGWGDDADPDLTTTALLVMGQARLSIRRRRTMAAN